ncbi:EmrB/QacA subfamily drug resistance transporter [Prauserella shujinwangii]|uniref:EmrB/QacA subfamily drug resistance transporter n=1 Tax=Prauserella shujinwangii TaxID=1453103 RepID=A0A2T0LLF7_9PSEU|nr:EmrB/QacA subfamily drug resistance transporter [Prauserella shujinwangii]
MLALACTAQFMVVLDLSVVNVALPAVRVALGFDQVGLQWVVTAYALAFAGFLLLGGRLADLYGRGRVFVAGLGVFAAASLVGGLATTPGTLVAARAVQGLGAAVLAPATLTVLTTTFPEGTRRTRALAAWTAVGIAGGAAGSLVGGVLTEYLSWRWILLVNVPLAVVAIPLARRLLGRDGHRPAAERGLDVAGAVTATAGFALLTYGVARTHEHGLADPVTGWSLLGGLGALAAFVVVELRLARAPLLPPALFRARTVSLGNVVLLLAGMCFNPMWFFLTLFMQRVLEYGPLRAGLGFLPHTLLTMAVGMWLTPRLMRCVACRTLIAAGAVVAAVGFLWQSRGTPADGYVGAMLGPAVLISLGSGLLTTPVTAMVTSGVPREAAGAASGVLNTAKQVGGAVGLAALAALAGGGGDRAALAAGYGRAFAGIAAILTVVALLALALPGRRHEAGSTPPSRVSGQRTSPRPEQELP